MIRQASYLFKVSFVSYSSFLEERTDRYIAGAAVMALEEKVENPTSLTTIVPCGISYSEASRFRSQAHIVFGDPIRVPTELAEMYRSGDKRSAIRSLEHEIREGLLNSSLACETDVNLLDVSNHDV